MYDEEGEGDDDGEYEDADEDEHANEDANEQELANEDDGDVEMTEMTMKAAVIGEKMQAKTTYQPSTPPMVHGLGGPGGGWKAGHMDTQS